MTGKTSPFNNFLSKMEINRVPSLLMGAVSLLATVSCASVAIDEKNSGSRYHTFGTLGPAKSVNTQFESNGFTHERLSVVSSDYHVRIHSTYDGFTWKGIRIPNHPSSEPQHVSIAAATDDKLAVTWMRDYYDYYDHNGEFIHYAYVDRDVHSSNFGPKPVESDQKYFYPSVIALGNDVVIAVANKDIYKRDQFGRPVLTKPAGINFSRFPIDTPPSPLQFSPGIYRDTADRCDGGVKFWTARKGRSSPYPNIAPEFGMAARRGIPALAAYIVGNCSDVQGGPKEFGLHAAVFAVAGSSQPVMYLVWTNLAIPDSDLRSKWGPIHEAQVSMRSDYEGGIAAVFSHTTGTHGFKNTKQPPGQTFAVWGQLSGNMPVVEIADMYLENFDAHVTRKRSAANPGVTLGRDMPSQLVVTASSSEYWLPPNEVQSYVVDKNMIVNGPVTLVAWRGQTMKKMIGSNAIGADLLTCFKPANKLSDGNQYLSKLWGEKGNPSADVISQKMGPAFGDQQKCAEREIDESDTKPFMKKSIGSSDDDTDFNGEEDLSIFSEDENFENQQN